MSSRSTKVASAGNMDGEEGKKVFARSSKLAFSPPSGSPLLSPSVAPTLEQAAKRRREAGTTPPHGVDHERSGRDDKEDEKVEEKKLTLLALRALDDLLHAVAVMDTAIIAQKFGCLPKKIDDPRWMLCAALNCVPKSV